MNNKTIVDPSFNKYDIIYLFTITVVFLLIISSLCFANKIKKNCPISKCCVKNVYVNKPIEPEYIPNCNYAPPCVGNV